MEITLSQLTDTMDATVHAIDKSPATPMRTGARVLLADTRKVWLQTEERQWMVAISEEMLELLFVNRNTNVVLREERHRVSDLTLPGAARIICQFILGVPEIPIDSRKAMRQIIDTARANAEYEYRQGMNHIIRGNPVENWDNLDMPDRWDAVCTAAMNTHAAPVGFMWYFRKAGVPFHAFDVYDDTYTETAFDMLSLLEVAR